MFAHVIANARGARDVVFSAHCHSDLGLAVANSLSAIQNGVRQVEGTINGIGERAGNTALEEVIMALRTRRDYYGNVDTGANVGEIMRTSRLVSRMCGFVVQRNKAIVGDNAFAHGAGIHQDGILKKRETYEIMDPVEIGWGVTELPLTKHSGRHALALRLKHLGYHLTDREMDSVFVRYKALGDKKKFVYDDDLATIVGESSSDVKEVWSLDYLSVTSGSHAVPTATVRMKRAGTGGEACTREDAGTGDGPVDATLKTIDRITGRHGKLMDYQLRAVSAGKDAIGEVTIKADFGKGLILTGKGASTDIIEASARAYLNAVNRSFARGK